VALNTGMNAGAWHSGDIAKLEKLFDTAATGTIAAGDKTVLGLIAELKDKVTDAKDWLTANNNAKKTAITDPVLKAAIDAVLGGTASTDADGMTKLSARYQAILDKLTALETNIENAVTGLFNVDPNAPTQATTNRSFAVQITADELTKSLNLKNELGGVMLKINAANMVANDSVYVLFDKADATKALTSDITGGRTFFANLDKDINLIIGNDIGKDGKLEKTVSLESFDDKYTAVATAVPVANSNIPEHLSLRLFQFAETPLDDKRQPAIFAFTFNKAINVKNLILGIKEKKVTFPSIHENGLVAERAVQGGASMDCKESLIVENNVELNDFSYLRALNNAVTVKETLTDSGSWVNVGTLSLKKGIVEGNSIWNCGKLILGEGGLSINGALELYAGTLDIPAAPTAPIFINLKGELKLANGLAIPVTENGDTAYFPIIRVTAVQTKTNESEKENKDTAVQTKTNESEEENKDNSENEVKAVLALGEGKAITLAEITKDKVNGNEKLSQVILVPKNANIEINGGEKEVSSLSLTNTNKGAHLIKIEEGGTVALYGKIKLNAASIDKGDDRGSAVYIGKDGTLIFGGQTVIEKGNITIAGTKIVFSVSDSEDGAILAWNGGSIIGDPNPEVIFDSQQITKKLGTEGLKKYKESLKSIKWIDLTGNTEVANITQKLENVKVGGGALDISEDTLRDALKAAAEGKVGEISANDIKVTEVAFDENPNDDETGDSDGIKNIVPGIDWSRVPGGLRKSIESAIQLPEDGRSSVEDAVVGLVLDDKIEEKEKKIALDLLSKGRTEEKARMTLQVIESVRDALYSKLEKESEGPYRNMWASVFGDTARSNVGGYKTDFDNYGFVVGADVRINDTWTVGILGGHGKAKAKYKGDWFFPNTNNRCDHKSYFGGIYSMWDDLITDLNLKFSLLAGHCNYDETLGCLDFADPNKTFQSDVSHKGFFVSGNIDATYKHWSAWGLDFGPWVSLAITNVHNRAYDNVIGKVVGEEDGVESEGDVKQAIGSANRRAVETILGVGASYDLMSNSILTFNLGYKHDFRRLKGGNARLSSSFDSDNEAIKYDLNNIKFGRDSFVAKADINMKFGQFGLSIGGHGQIGNHFKDIAGSITASYSF
jgi:uncharacterized protein with beta-barrel porin domain